MEPIIEFFEQYWGYTLAGGVSLGTIITGIYMNLRSMGIIKTSDTRVGKLITKLDEAVVKYEQSEEARIASEQENQYLKQVIATSFKATSYLILASKLPIEDKLAIQEEFTTLSLAAKDTAIKIANETGTEVKESVTPILKGAIPDVMSAVTDTVTHAKTIFDKYVSKGDQ